MRENVKASSLTPSFLCFQTCPQPLNRKTHAKAQSRQVLEFFGRLQVLALIYCTWPGEA